MRLAINLVSLASLPSLFLWIIYDLFLIGPLLHLDPVAILLFVGGNWAWYTLIKSCIVYNLRKTLSLDWTDKLGMLAGIAILACMVVVGLGMDNREFLVTAALLYFPPFALAVLLHKINRLD